MVFDQLGLRDEAAHAEFLKALLLGEIGKLQESEVSLQRALAHWRPAKQRFAQDRGQVDRRIPFRTQDFARPTHRSQHRCHALVQ